MPFLDVPSVAPTPSSFLLDESKLGAGRPQPATELTEASVSLPGGGRREGAGGAGYDLPQVPASLEKRRVVDNPIIFLSYLHLRPA